MIEGLDVISTEFIVTSWVITGAILVLAGILLYRRRHRRRPLLRWSGWAALSTAAVLVASAASVNAYYAYLPTVNDVQQAATGDRQWVDATSLEHLSPSAQRRANRAGLVVRQHLPADPADGFKASTSVAYLPPQYFSRPDDRFPVVYLFHGSPGQASDWFHAGRAEQEGQAVAAAGHPAIVVAPRMSRSWTDDPECVDGRTEKVETHLIDHVIPAVDASFRTSPDRADRTFAGMSAGGYCALNLGLRHRDLVSTIIDLSGDTEPTHDGGAATLFGRVDPSAAVAANNPAEYAASLAPTPPMRVWLDSGTADTGVQAELSRLDRDLRAAGQEVVWRVRPGGHTYWVWTSAMSEAMPWALGATAASKDARSRPGP